MVAETRFAGYTSWRRHPYAWGILLLAAALGWMVTVQQAAGMSGMGAMHPTNPSALVFLPVWVAMMVAMMFPAVAPVLSLIIGAGRKKRVSGGKPVPAWVFMTGYLLIWTVFGLGAYLLSLAIPAVGMAGSGIKSENSLAAGVVLVFAGLYEWSPIKGACLRHCRSPLGVFMTHWRDGWTGALRMGIVHGAFCLGCCWGLMLVLFAVGLMNLIAMVLLAIVIFAQKVLPFGNVISRGTGTALLVLGVAIAMAPVL